MTWNTLKFCSKPQDFMFNVVVVVFVHSVAPSLRHCQALLLFILFVIFMCVYVCVHACVHASAHVCACAPVVSVGMWAHVPWYTSKSKGQPQGLTLAFCLVWDGLLVPGFCLHLPIGTPGLQTHSGVPEFSWVLGSLSCACRASSL